jgi:hypothetical protein
MGVSVRLSRNVRVYLPFWVAIPAWLFAAAIWAAILLVWALVLIARAIGAGTVYLAHSGSKAIGDRQARQPAHARAGGQQAARQEAFTAGRQEFARQRAEREEARPAQPLLSPKPSRAPRRRTTTPGFEDAHGLSPEPRPPALPGQDHERRAQAARQARADRSAARREAARQLAAERKARRAARTPLSWPGWGNVAAVVLFITGFVLAAVAGPNANGPAGLTAGFLFIAAIGTAAVCVPVGVWRMVRRRGSHR